MACLGATLETGHEVTLGVYVPQSTGLLQTARIALKHRGPAAVVRGAAKLAWARLGAMLRSVSGARTGFASLREMAKNASLSAIDVTHLEDPETVEKIRALRPDIIVVAGFSRILRSEVIDIPRRGCINVHPSLLPAYRGPNPIYWVLANGETETGVTVHFMEVTIDSGDIIAQRPVPIRSGDDERALFERCTEASTGLLQEVLHAFEQGRVEPIPQDPEKASYFSHPPRGASKL